MSYFDRFVLLSEKSESSRLLQLNLIQSVLKLFGKVPGDGKQSLLGNQSWGRREGREGGGEVGEETEGTTMFTVSKRIYSESFVYCTLPAPETFTDQCNCADKNHSTLTVSQITQYRTA